jgi:predicted nucleic acid-binding protein
MFVVADTTPLNYLVLLGKIELLPAIYERVVIPPVVLAELNHRNTPPEVSSGPLSFLTGVPFLLPCLFLTMC